MRLFTCLFPLVFLVIHSTAEFRLSDSKLLLPYFSVASVNYTISGSGGSCYEWWSGTPEVVTVAPIGDTGQTCTEKASVAAVWQSPLRRTATIYARDSVTSHVLKCDVIVDDIHSIKVDTTTQELYLHNTPESLVVIAYDEFGNTFSSLDGIPFEWKIHPGSEKDSKITGDGVLRFLTWTESEYSTPSRIGQLEADGMQGYMQLVSGLRTGSSVVSAALREPGYSQVPPAKVRLLVMANAQLNPPVLYLIPKARAYLQVIVVRQDGDEEVKMPSSQYYLSVADERIVDLDAESGSMITAEKNGQTTVTLLDRNVEEAISMLGSNITDVNDSEAQMLAHHRRPTSIVYVVEPAYFRFSVQPVGEDAYLCIKAASQSSHASGNRNLNHWTLETGKEYNLNLELYDQNNHRIFPSDNIRIAVEFPEGSLELLQSSGNGTSHVVVARKTGTITVKATLEGVVTDSGDLKSFSHRITGSQELTAYSPIKVFPSKINVAWDPSMSTSEGFKLSAIGGSEDYIWTVLSDKDGNSDVVSITQDGVMFVKGVGSAVVVVSDLRNPAMCSHSTIRVNNFANLGFSQGRVEVYLPKSLLPDGETRLASALAARSVDMDVADLLPHQATNQHPLSHHEKMENAILSVGLKAFDIDGNAITFCHNLPITVKPIDPSIVKVLPGLQYLPSSVKNGQNSDVCGFVRVVGLREGFTELEAYFTTGDRKEEQKSVSRFPIAVYKDISFLPDNTVVAVATGSSRRISFKDGPNPWELDTSSHFVEVKFTEAPTGKTNPTLRQKPQAFVSQENTSLSGFTFILRCESTGNFEVNVVIGNRPSSTNLIPAVLSTPLSVVCDIPAKVELIPHLDLPSLPKGFSSCPIINRSFGSSEDIIPFSNNAPLNVEVIVKGYSGLELTGVDSVDMTTQITVNDGGRPDDVITDAFPKIYNLKTSGDSILPTRPRFAINPKNLGESAGLLNVAVLAKHRGKKTTDLESLMTLKMAPKVAIEPLEDFQLLLHPNAFANIHLSHGSGYFHFEVLPSSKRGTSEACLSVKTSEASQRDFILHPKCKSRVTIRATDLCFPAEPVHGQAEIEPAYDERVVSIVGIGSLRLYAPAQMEVNSKAPIYIRALDTEGKTLSAQFVHLLDLRITTTPSESGSQSIIVSCQDSPAETSKNSYWLSKPTASNLPGLAKANICSQSPGLSKLKAVSGSVTSNVESVNVYAPLSLKPCNLNLLLGASHQIATSGGPVSRSLSFDVSTEKSGQPKLSFSEVGEEGDGGIIIRSSLGKVGVAAVSVKATSSAGYADLNTSDFEAWGLNPPPKSLYSQASCRINVVALSGIRIGCPLTHTPSEGRILVASRGGNASLNGVPVWAEGVATIGGNAFTVTPMGMADIQPPLHFSWRLSPPMPNAPAQLFHWLSNLSVDPEDTALSSGMILVGTAPGQVKLHLTVFTDGEALTGQLTSQPTSRSSSQAVKQLSTEITFTIIPHLSLINPPRANPRIMVSPNSRLQLTLPQEIAKDGEADYSIHCPTTAPASMLQVSSTGLLEAGHYDRCSSPSDWRLSACLCSLRIDYRLVSGADRGSERGHQTLAVDVIVKPALYTLALALPGPSTLRKSSEGLPFGGPYPIRLSFHDDVGEVFDAVSESLLALNLQAHRSSLLDYSINSNAGQIGAQLYLRLTPPLRSSSETPVHSTTTLKMTHESDSATQLAQSYLTIPVGPLLTINGISEFTVGQWACLPSLPQGDGLWTSSDPNLLWVDNVSKFMLPLRAGHVHLQFTPDSSKFSLIGRLAIINVCSRVNQEVQTKSSTMPVGLESTQEILVHVKLAQKNSYTMDGSCSSAVLRSHLSAISPLTCSTRLELEGGISEPQQWVTLPNWLRGFLLAERISRVTNVVVDSDLAVFSDPAVTQSTDFRAEITPSNSEAGSWTCSVRSSEPSEYYRLAVLPVNSRLVVEVKSNCGTGSDEVISRSDLHLVPAFRLIVPSLHIGSPEPLLLTPRAPKADLLVFIPLATLAQMDKDGGSDRGLKARSQRPDLLSISYAPQPVTSPKVVKAAIERMIGETGYASNWGSLFRNLSLMMENEAQASHEQALGHGMLWSLGIKALPTKTATDAVVDIVLSLKVTGQHVTVPIRVQTRSAAHAGELTGGEGDYEEDSGVGGFWTNLSWLNLLLLIFLSILLIVASQVVTRSLSGGGYGVGSTAQQKDLPPIPNGGASPFGGPVPRLWSQGFGAPGAVGTVPGNTTNQITPPRIPGTSFGANRLNLSPLGDNLGYMAGETPARFRGSPSRLREAFDSSL